MGRMDHSSPGWLKLNVDGSADDNRGVVGEGGVHRNSMGNLVGGFSTRFGGFFK